MRDRYGDATAGKARMLVRSDGNCAYFLGETMLVDSVTHIVSGTKREAESALAAFLTDIQRRQRPTSSRVRFGFYAKCR
jgi:hypothetical protein